MENQTKISETEIIERVLNGEKALFEVIVRRYNPFLYKIGRSYNFNHEDAEDLMQETYIDAYKSLSQFEKRSNFKTWLFRIMINNCYRKKKRSSFKYEFTPETISETITPMFMQEHSDITKDIYNRELRAILEKSLSELPEEYRLVFSLRELNDMSVAETADLLNISESNVKVRFSRAKSMMRQSLESQHTKVELFEFNLTYCNPLTARVMKIINEL
ncbi:MAG: sigma-70 family RNA polymerase sigma factor [Bacteroidales bacterium]